MCVNLSIAVIAPAMGGYLFIGMVVVKVSICQIVTAIWPYVLVEFIVLFMIIYVPAFTMFVPKLLGFVG